MRFINIFVPFDNHLYSDVGLEFSLGYLQCVLFLLKIQSQQFPNTNGPNNTVWDCGHWSLAIVKSQSFKETVHIVSNRVKTLSRHHCMCRKLQFISCNFWWEMSTLHELSTSVHWLVRLLVMSVTQSVHYELKYWGRHCTYKKNENLRLVSL